MHVCMYIYTLYSEAGTQARSHAGMQAGRHADMHPVYSTYSREPMCSAMSYACIIMYSCINMYINVYMYAYIHSIN